MNYLEVRTMKRLLYLTLISGLLLVSCSNYESQLASKVKPNLKNGANASKVTKEVLNRTGGIEASQTRLEKWKKYCNDNIDENTIKDIVEKGYYQSLGASQFERDYWKSATIVVFKSEKELACNK